MSDLEAHRLSKSNPSWSPIKLKFLSALVGGGTPSKDKEEFWTGGDIPWVSPKDMKVRDISDTEDHITPEAVDQSATSFVPSGSPMIVARSGILRHTIPVAIARTNVTLNQDMKAFRVSSKLDPEFLAFWIEGQSKDLLLEWRQFGATVESLDSFRLLNSRIALPGLPTQKRIAALLDRETARIDELIAKKERLGGVIDQRRLAVITAAVAGKIGPAAETTAAQGVTKREIRLRFMLQVAPSAREVENLTAEDEVTFAPMDALDDGLGGLDASMCRPLGEVAAGSYNYFREGDVLLAKVTPCFENGKKALARGLINGVGFATSEVHVFRPTPGKLDARFLMYLFSSEDFRAEGMKSMTGAGGLKRVSDAAILNYRPHVIDVDLQRKVADFLDREMGVFEVIKDRTKASIGRLREYRAALITSAVTGQIDVDSYGKSGTPTATLDRIEEEMQG